jgi:hypothetical protein
MLTDFVKKKSVKLVYYWFKYLNITTNTDQKSCNILNDFKHVNFASKNSQNRPRFKMYQKMLQKRKSLATFTTKIIINSSHERILLQ